MDTATVCWSEPRSNPAAPRPPARPKLPPCTTQRWPVDVPARNDVDRAAKGIGAEQRRARAVENLDPLHIVKRNRDIAVVMARLRVVHANAVDEHEHLAEVRAAHGKIRLHAANAARTHVNRRHEPQHVGDRMRRQRVDLLRA